MDEILTEFSLCREMERVMFALTGHDKLVRNRYPRIPSPFGDAYPAGKVGEWTQSEMGPNMKKMTDENGFTWHVPKVDVFIEEPVREVFTKNGTPAVIRNFLNKKDESTT